MTNTVGNIPLLDLASFLMETPDMPMHVGTLQIYRPVSGTRAQIVERILTGFRDSEIAPPFNYIPVFPPFGLPKWAIADTFDVDYHIRHVTLPRPGYQRQLIDLVMDLHTGVLDRDRPCWIAYVIDGLRDNCLAVYWKVHHAYIDGASVMMRADVAVARSVDDLEVRALWSPLLDAPPARESTAGFAPLRTVATTAKDLFGALQRQALQAGGLLQRETPLLFSAPHSLFNAPVHAARRLGVGSLDLARFKAIATPAAASINDVALTLVGAALERYIAEHEQPPSRPLIAVCPMSIRAEGDTSASTQIAAIPVKLGEPGSSIAERLRQVNFSAVDAKAEARAMSREALMGYILLQLGAHEVLGRSPLATWTPPMTNVNVSNVAGPRYRCFLAGAECERSYPVSTLAGGTAINITFASCTGRMDFAVITDAVAIPDAQRIADYIEAALDELEAAVQPPPPPKAKAKPRRASAKTAKRRSK